MPMLAPVFMPAPNATPESDPLKVLVFAHVPPPHHGQSYMVQLMLAGLGGDHATGAANAPFGVACYHVDARFSDDLQEVGGARFGKLGRLLRYCLRALRYRFRFGLRTLYYIPAPPRLTPLLRDWVALALLRPFFPRLILHWHAVGLGAWIARQPWPCRVLTRLCLGRAANALVLSRLNEADAREFNPRRVTVVANGIPDPCPDFHARLAAVRQERRRARAAALATRSSETFIIHVLYLAHCTAEKGLFDTLAAVQLANARLAEAGSGARFQLQVAGKFMAESERAEFERRLQQPGVGDCCRYVGFVSAPDKQKLLQTADVFCFPTYYANEGQPANLIEAFGCGLPVVTTRWRAIPEFFPADYPGLVEPRQPAQIAAALIAVAGQVDGLAHRQRFENEFLLESHLQNLAAALRA